MGLILDEIDNPPVMSGSASVLQPLVHRRFKPVNVEPRHQRRIEIGQLIFIAVVHRRDDDAAGGQPFAGERFGQGQFHHRLQHLGPAAVQFVQKQHDRLFVGGPPRRRQKLAAAGLLVLVQQPDQIARIAHLPQKERDDLHAPLGEIATDQFRFADAVTSHQHHVLLGRCRPKDLAKFVGVNRNRHSAILAG